MYKTHKNLPKKSQSKISSLYVLDSLVRGVHKLYKSSKEKDGKTAGFAKGFLTKVEGVLEGWSRDMCSGWPEGRVSQIRVPLSRGISIDRWNNHGTLRKR
jgi:hypothetical protein